MSVKMSKVENPELPAMVKNALCSYVKDEEEMLTKSEIENAWIKFHNLLEVELAQKKIGLFDRLRNAIPVPYIAVPGLATAVIISALVFGNTEVFNNEIDNQLAKAEKPSNRVLPTNSELEHKDIKQDEFSLPKAERFSELVKFVKDDSQNLVPYQRQELDQRLSARLSSEIENSLKTSFQLTNINQNPHLVFVAND